MNKISNFVSENGILLLIVIYIFFVLLVNPWGEFPFSDDFSYTGPVKHLLDTGELRITDWSSMTLVGHVIIGWLVSSVFGFSFSVLRLTTLLFGLLGTIGLYKLALEFTAGRMLVFFTSLLFMICAPIFMFSFSYVTDISFLSLSIWIIYFFIQFLKKNSFFYFVIAVLINLYALLTRELAIAIPAGFFIAYLYRNGISPKKLIISLLPLLIVTAEYFLFQYWFENVHGLTKNMEFSRNKMMTVLTSGFAYTLIIYAKNIVYSFLYIGFFLSPLLFFAVYQRISKFTKSLRRYYIPMLFGGTIFITAIIMNVNKLRIDIKDLIMPHLFVHNIKLANVYNPSSEFVLEYSLFVKVLLFALAAAGAITLLFLLGDFIIRYLKENNKKIFTKRDGRIEFIIFVLLAYCFPVFSQILFERYLFLPLLFILIIIISGLKEIRSWKRIVPAAVMVLFVFQIYYGVSLARDMMQYNRTRWKALNYLTEELKIDKAEIDGGFEFNAWYFYEWDFPQKSGKNWWWVHDDKYIVIWGTIRGFRTLKEYTYYSMFPPCFENKIYVLKRE